MLLNYLRSLLFSNTPLRSAPSDNRPTGAQLRNPAEFHQSNALEAAVMKRRRRAKKLFNQASYSADQNRAHYDESDNLRDSLNPFYIAK